MQFSSRNGAPQANVHYSGVTPPPPKIPHFGGLPLLYPLALCTHPSRNRNAKCSHPNQPLGSSFTFPSHAKGWFVVGSWAPKENGICILRTYGETNPYHPTPFQGFLPSLGRNRGPHNPQELTRKSALFSLHLIC